MRDDGLITFHQQQGEDRTEGDNANIHAAGMEYGSREQENGEWGEKPEQQKKELLVPACREGNGTRLPAPVNLGQTPGGEKKGEKEKKDN